MANEGDLAMMINPMAVRPKGLFGGSIPIDESLLPGREDGESVEQYLLRQKAVIEDVLATHRRECRRGIIPTARINSILQLAEPLEVLIDMAHVLAELADARDSDARKRAIRNRANILIEICLQYAPRNRSLRSITTDCFARRPGYFEIDAEYFKMPDAMVNGVFSRPVIDRRGLHERLERYIYRDRGEINENYLAARPETPDDPRRGSAGGERYKRDLERWNAFWAVGTGRLSFEDDVNGMAGLFRNATVPALRRHPTKAIRDIRHFAPHAVRYIVATHWLKKTGNIEIAAQAIHASPATTARFYVEYGNQFLEGRLISYLSDYLKTLIKSDAVEDWGELPEEF